MMLRPSVSALGELENYDEALKEAELALVLHPKEEALECITPACDSPNKL